MQVCDGSGPDQGLGSLKVRMQMFIVPERIDVETVRLRAGKELLWWGQRRREEIGDSAFSRNRVNRDAGHDH